MLYEKKTEYYVSLFAAGLSNDGVRLVRGTVLQKIRLGAGSRQAISVKKSWGGYRRTTPSIVACVNTVQKQIAKNVAEGVEVALCGLSDGVNDART